MDVHLTQTLRAWLFSSAVLDPLHHLHIWVFGR
jgi:hypothetical protein